MEWIKREVGWREPQPQFDPHLQIPGLSFDPQAIHAELMQLLDILPAVSWRSQTPGSLWGLSLSYNPQAPKQEWHQASFGHPRYQALNPTAYFTAPEQERERAVRGDYLDSLSFRRLLPELQALPQLNALLARFRMPLVRCTLRMIDGTLAQPSLSQTGGMHCDDSPCEVLRVNVCITGSADFGLQYQGHAPTFLKPGEHRVINTDVPHRVWIGKRSALQRIHLVLGLAPWLDYDMAHDVWRPNAHWGRTHPFDLVRTGLAWS